MKSIISKYMSNIKNGLVLLDAPTGFGKTTAIIEYIKEYLENTSFTCERIFYITNLKKNLPVEDLKKVLGIDNFEKNCLVLKPYYENIIDNWEKVIINDKAILNSEHYKKLDNAVKNLKKIGDKNLLKSIESNIEKVLEVNFRSFIKKSIFNGKTFEEKKKYIKTNEWIRVLYPTTIIANYKIILLTTKKFVSLIDPFYKVPYHFYSNEIIRNSAVFIDEFDATKNEVLDVIINDGLKTKVDIIKLFLNIYYSLKNIKIPNIIMNLETSSISEEERKNHSAREILNINLKKFDELYKKYNLQFMLKTKNMNEDKSFLFHDGNYVSITKNSTRKHLLTEINEEESQRLIYTSKYAKENNEKLIKIVEEVEYMINYFINGISWIALDYQNYKNKNKKDSADYSTIEECIKSCLSLFNLDDENMNFLMELITIKNFKKQLNLTYDKNDGFLRTGLEILEIEDSDYHDLKSIIHKLKFKITPEELIIMICKEAKVFGVSATATLETNLGNYDLKYLKKKLGDDYHILKPEDLKYLEQEFFKTQKDYKLVDLNVEIVDDYAFLNPKDKCEELIKKIFPIEKQQKYIDKNKLDYYYYEISLKIAYVYKKFIENSNLNSLVCFLNGLPSMNKNGVYKEDLAELFKDIYPEIEPLYINSSNFDEEMSKVYKALSNKEKCFVITTYATLGTGKNIHYTIPNGLIDNMIMNDITTMKKDFDGIYLLTPTNLLQTLDSNSNNKFYDISKFVFQQEYLYRVHKNYSLMLKNITNGFKKLFFSKSFAPIDYRNIDLYLNNAKIIIQAIGRICRSRNKNKKIFIFSDREIVVRLKNVNDILSKRLLNYEFDSLLKKEFTDIELQLDEFSNRNKQIKEDLKRMSKTVRSSLTKNYEWKNLRDLALKFPTYNGSKEDLDKYYFDFGFPISMYGYKFGSHFNFSQITFNSYDYINQVSIHNSGLDLLLEIDCIEKYFTKKDYAKEFKKGNKIMSVAFYNQIYLGALGEIAGKIILENRLGIDLEEIDDYTMYELFDYKIGNTYIDFKNWRTFEKDNDSYVAIIMSKLKRVNGSKAIIINLFKQGEGKKYIENVPQNVIQIPWLIDPDTNDIDDKQIDLIEEFY